MEDKKTASRKFNFGCISLDMTDDEVRSREEEVLHIHYKMRVENLERFLRKSFLKTSE
jgi:hypothetical protein